ncbi:YadA-like family protein, partial [Paraburkholderia sediminicola]|uniref:YadA family autotransporter adhesin n=1 Tax=Paraburkholderia sediminicola TaxID=458836 RepID=UPI0038B71846
MNVSFADKAANTRTLTNVTAGVNDTDAVNVSQLKGVQGQIGDLDSLAVKYDQNENGTPNYNSVTMGGGKSDGLVTIHNVAAGVDDTDAVNVSQLKGIQGTIGDLDSLAVKYDDTSRSTITLGGFGTGTLPVTLTNVAEGKSTYDAVNYGQLSKLQDQVTNIDSRVTNVESGGVSNPYFDATDNDLQTGGDRAMANVAVPGTGVGSTAAGSGATSAGNNATALGSNASAKADNSVALGAGSVADRGNTVSVGAAGAERQITNVAEGTQGTDAVNLNQLNAATTTSNAYTDQRIAGVQNQINDVAKGAYGGIAAATALTMIPDVDKGKTLSFGVGVSSYKGYQAVALGGTARITDNIKVKAGAGMSSVGTTVGVGASYQW